MDNARVSTALLYAVRQGENRRVSTGLVYAVTQNDERRVSTALIYAVTIPPFPVVINGTPDSATQITITTVRPGDDATDHELYRGTASGALTLLASGLGPTPAPYVDTPLLPATDYYYQMVPIGSIDLPSSEILVTTMGFGSPPDPRATVTSATTAILSAPDPGDGVIEVFYRVRPTSATDWTSPLFSHASTDATRFAVTATPPFTSGVQYELQMQFRRAGGKSSWASFTWTHTFVAVSQTHAFTTPIFGQPIAGTSVLFSLTLPNGITLVAAEISDDDATWTPLPAPASGATSYTLDTTGFADGFYTIRFTLTNAQTIEHPGFVIDNAGDTEFIDRFDQAPNWYSRHWTPSTTTHWMIWPPVFAYHAAHIGPNPPSSVGWADPANLAFNDGVMATAEFAAWSAGGGFYWDKLQSTELLNMGLQAFSAGSRVAGQPGPGDPAVSVRAFVRHSFMGTALGTCDESGFGSGTFEVHIGTPEPTGGVGYPWHSYVETIPVAASWIGLTALQSPQPCGARYSPYYLMLRVTRPDPMGVPNRLHIVARLRSWSGAAVTIDRTVDVVDESDDPVVLDCGAVTWSTWKGDYPGRGSAFSPANDLRTLRSMGATVLSEGPCGPPPPIPVPIIPEPVEFVPEPSRPCIVELTVYEVDGITPAWRVSTDPQANLPELPYLCEPDHYGEQEVDPIGCRGTITTARAPIADVRQTPGDQDSGFVTERIFDELERQAIMGRRVRIRRYISPEDGWITIVDGPGDTISLESDYASFAVPVLDSREHERKAAAFLRGSTTTLMPRGTTIDFGPFVASPPVLAEFDDAGGFGNSYFNFLPTQWSGGGTVATADVFVPPKSIEAATGTEVYDPAFAGLFRVFGFPNAHVWWREIGGDDDDWVKIKPRMSFPAATPLAEPPNLFVTQPDANDDPHVTTVYFLPFVSVNPQGIPMPVHGEAYEVLVVYAGEISEDFPFHVDDTLGGLYVRAASGEFTARKATPGHIPVGFTDTALVDPGVLVPLSVRYDPVAVAALTDPVLMRITESATDLRDWLEEFAWGPSGWIPAFDSDLRVSPLHRSFPPIDSDGLALINNAITEPAPNYQSGDPKSVVNIIDYTYERYAQVSGFVDGYNLAPDAYVVKVVRHIWLPDDAGVAQYIDPVALEQHFIGPSFDQFGPRPLVVNGRLFSSIGTLDLAPATGTFPLQGPIEDEIGYTLAQEAAFDLLPRYWFGAPTIDVNVMRRFSKFNRPGHYVELDLSWFPERSTRRRGMQGFGHILAIKDLDCEWRGHLIEIVPGAVTAVGPTACFTFEQTEDDYEEFLYRFDATCTTAGRSPVVSYAWEVRDPDGVLIGEGSGLFFFFAFPAEPGGTYTVTLTATDSRGVEDSSTQEVEIPLAALMPFNDIIDPFDGSAINSTHWPTDDDGGAVPVVAGGQLTITPASDGDYYEYRSAAGDFRQRYLYIQYAALGEGSDGYMYVYPPGGAGGPTYYGWDTGGPELSFWRGNPTDGGVQEYLAPFDPSTEIPRLRVEAGVVYFEISTDGGDNWTVHFSEATGAWLNDAVVAFGAVAFDDSPEPVVFEGVNVYQAPAPEGGGEGFGTTIFGSDIFGG